MKTKLHPADFEMRKLEDNGYQYMSYEWSGGEITIEPNGANFDIALYDHNGILDGRRKTVRPRPDVTDLTDTFTRAALLANEMYVAKVFGNGAIAA